MKKNFNTPITIISLIACYFAVKYLINNHSSGNDILMFMLAMGTCLLYAWTIYFGIREKTFLVLLKVIISFIAFGMLVVIWPFHEAWLYFTGKEIRWLYSPAHWLLKKIKSIK